MTVLELLNWSVSLLRDHQIDPPQLDAELLLARALDLNREKLYIRLRDPVQENEQRTLETLIQRRIAGEPLQYILGEQEFWSIGLKVDPRVFIPRPETELLVEQTLLILSKRRFQTNPFVLEIGTGSGAIAIALAKEVRDLSLIATDISLEALRLAKENAKMAGVQHQIVFVNANLFDPFHPFREGGAFDLIVSNPPYINRSEIQTLSKEIKHYEPTVALDGGEDGLAFYRHILSQAPFYLRKGGWVLLEVGQGQSERVVNLVEKEALFSKPEIIPDLSGIGRVVKAQKF